MKPQLIENRAVDLATIIYRKQIVKWIKELKHVKSFDSHINISPMPGPFQKLLHKSMLLSHLSGIDHTQVEIKKQLEGEFKDTVGETWEVTPFDKAINKLKKKRIISAADFKAADSSIKDIAFSIQRIERMNTLIMLKKSLLRHFEQGLAVDDWKKSLRVFFEAHGVTPLESWHIRTVFLTNILSIYNNASFHTAVSDSNVEYIQYLGIEDHRASDICLPFFNMIYDKNDPIWDSIRPLNHYNCRCSTLPITKAYAKRNNLKVSGGPSATELKNVHKDFKNKSSGLTLGDHARMIKKQISEKDKQIDKLNFRKST